METISENEQNDIDLDIINVLKRVPKNNNYTTLYVRMSFPDETIFIDFWGAKEDIYQTFLQLISFCEDKDEEFKIEAYNAILELAINILSTSSKETISNFNNDLKEKRTKLKNQ